MPETYTFRRPNSKDLPPKFQRIVDRLEIEGIYNSALEHPSADWNMIRITVFERVNFDNLEKVFKEFGYSGKVNSQAPTSSNSHKM